MIGKKEKSKLRWAYLLSALSLALLVLLQTYWLNRTYRAGFNALHREIGLVLRETMLTRQLNLIMDSSSMHKLSVGNNRFTFTTTNNAIRLSIDSVKHPRMSRRMRRPDMLFKQMTSHEETQTDSLVVSAPLIFGSNALPEIDTALRANLKKANLPHEYELRTGKAEFRIDSLTFTQGNERRQLGEFGGSNVVARFNHPFWFILSRMRMQLFFSLALLLLLPATLYWMIRNLRQQLVLTANKNNLISNITHELKTPIATVSVAVEALQNFNAMNDPERTKKYLDISSVELQRLNLLVDRVLRLSMFESDSMEFSVERLDVNALIEQVLQSMSVQFEKAGAQVSFTQADVGAHHVLADEMHLQSVIFNLADNALKYGGNPPQILITTKQQDEWVEISVADNGKGIAPEFRTRVFDKFFRISDGDKHNVKGYGLGLSYVTEVVKRMHGTIHIEQNEPAGARFVVRLKRA